MITPFYINGKPFPAPKRFPNIIVSTTVNGSRNVNNEVVGQKVGRDNYKVSNLEWPLLDAATWAAMLQELDKFFVTLKFPDMVTNTWRELTVYPGDRSADIYELDGTGFPLRYANCKVNLVDAGWNG